MAQNKHVTLVITHTLRPDQAQRYEQWLGKIMPLAAEFPGHLGANVIRPTDGQNLWNIIIRFDTLEHLYNWTQSDTRRELVEEIAPLLAEGCDTLILGCTHYPLLMDVISDYMGAGVTLIDTGEQAALAAAALLAASPRPRAAQSTGGQAPVVHCRAAGR